MKLQRRFLTKMKYVIIYCSFFVSIFTSQLHFLYDILKFFQISIEFLMDINFHFLKNENFKTHNLYLSYRSLRLSAEYLLCDVFKKYFLLHSILTLRAFIDKNYIISLFFSSKCRIFVGSFRSELKSFIELYPQFFGTYLPIYFTVKNLSQVH